MQNKNNSQNEDSAKKLSYSIQTMNSDIKNQKATTSSFDIEKEKPETPKQPEKKESEQPEKKGETFNPFLKDLKSFPEKSLEENSSPERKKEEPLNPKKTNEVQTETFKKPPIKPVINNKNSSNILDKDAEEETNKNQLVLLVLFVISLITVFAGAYYFYSSSTPEVISESQPKTEEIISEIVSEPEKILFETKLLSIDENNTLIGKLLESKDTLNESQVGYYQIESLSFKEVLSLLEIQLPEDVTNQFNDGWLVVTKESNALKVGILAKVTDPESLVLSMKNNEYRLPEILKSLFVDESFVLQDEQVEFKDSGELAGVRYYNLVDGIASKSIDWGVINNRYLVITTSKNFINSLFESLIDSEQKKVTKSMKQS